MWVSSLNFRVAAKAEVESTKLTSPVPGRRRGSKGTDAGRTCRSIVAPLGISLEPRSGSVPKTRRLSIARKCGEHYQMRLRIINRVAICQWRFHFDRKIRIVPREGIHYFKPTLLR